MTHWRTSNPDALSYNREWRKAQGLPTQPRQNAMVSPHKGHTEPEKPAVIHPTTPEPAGETPQECRECTVSKECKAILKLWYKKKPRPELVRAWCRLMDTRAVDMICLSKLTTKVDLRRDK